MKKIFIQGYESPVGDLIVGAIDDQICLLDWADRAHRERIDKRVKTFFQADYAVDPVPILEEAITQLQDYFSGQREAFDLPVVFAGTNFQQRIWQALQTIPFGQTCSYLELAKQIGHPESVRAVANAVGANAISIVVPCHRVIGAKGQLTGYAGGLEAKQQLLQLEQALL